MWWIYWRRDGDGNFAFLLFFFKKIKNKLDKKNKKNRLQVLVLVPSRPFRPENDGAIVSRWHEWNPRARNFVCSSFNNNNNNSLVLCRRRSEEKERKLQWRSLKSNSTIKSSSPYDGTWSSRIQTNNTKVSDMIFDSWFAWNSFVFTKGGLEIEMIKFARVSWLPWQRRANQPSIQPLSQLELGDKSSIATCSEEGRIES